MNNKREEKKREENETQSVADRLPKLTEEEQGWAASPGFIADAWSLIGEYKPGEIVDYEWADIQVVSIDTIRCVRVYNHPQPFWNLSMFRAICENAGLFLEMDPYTIVTPYFGDTQKTSLHSGTKEWIEEKRSRVKQQTTVDQVEEKENGYNFGMEWV